MSTPTIHAHISQFDVRNDGTIHLRITRTVMFGEDAIASSFWRTVLEPNDPRAEELLGGEPFYLSLAQQAWASLEGGNA